MPADTIYVGRPTIYGNYSGDLDSFRLRAQTLLSDFPEIRKKLRGHNLACWCKLTDPCHADIWLELVNE